MRCQGRWDKQQLWEWGGHAALLKALPYFDRLPTSWKFPPPGLPGNQLNMRDSCRQPLGINAWIEICCPKLAGWQASASACEIPCAKPLPQELSLFLAILLCKKLRERFKHAQRKPKQLRCKLTKKKGFSIFRISFCMLATSHVFWFRGKGSKDFQVLKHLEQHLQNHSLWFSWLLLEWLDWPLVLLLRNRQINELIALTCHANVHSSCSPRKSPNASTASCWNFVARNSHWTCVELPH